MCIYAHMSVCYLNRNKCRLVSVVLLNVLPSDSYLGVLSGRVGQDSDTESHLASHYQEPFPKILQSSLSFD